MAEQTPVHDPANGAAITREQVAHLARLARIDWRSRRGNGAYALWIAGDGTVDILAVDDLRGDRPWVRKPP